MPHSTRSERIGKTIKMFRDQCGLTQDDLATRVNLSGGAQIAQYEAGTKLPSLDKAMDLAAQLGVSLSQLVGEHPPSGAAPGHVTNHIHGDNQTVYQHVERAYLGPEDLAPWLRALLAPHLDALRQAVRDGMREALQGSDGRRTPP